MKRGWLCLADGGNVDASRPDFFQDRGEAVAGAGDLGADLGGGTGCPASRSAGGARIPHANEDGKKRALRTYLKGEVRHSSERSRETKFTGSTA